MSDTLWVFVYGTLRKGGYNHRVIAPYALQTVPGKVRAKMYSWTSYPVAVLDDPNPGVIVGEWVEIDPKGLPDLDRLEGYRPNSSDNLYDRTTVTDIENGHEGLMYVMTTQNALRRRYSNREVPVVESGDWLEFYGNPFADDDEDDDTGEDGEI